jgi:molybdopterin molybdotransferase
VFTGAVLPGGADTVMMQEDCVAEDGFVTIRPGIRKGANRREAGEDVAAGAVALKAGARLRPQDIGLAAAVGRGELMVRSPLTVALFSTGDELVEPGRPPEFGKIYDSNRYTLAALLTELGAAVTDLGILPDRREVVSAALAEAARGHDLVLTSGGVSVGEEDHVRGVVEALGSLHFWRLAIKPGRPIAVGQLGRTPFVGLPGNPVAAMVTFLVIGRPLVLLLSGATDVAAARFPVVAGFDYKKKKGRREWARVRIEANGDGRPVAQKYRSSGAGILASMVEADGLLELGEDMDGLKKGAVVDFLPFSGVMG